MARFLARSGVEVIEVGRHNRQNRRRQGKSDPIDAVEAARAVLSGSATGRAKSRDGAVEAIRVLVVAKRSARQARVKALTQMRQLAFTAPDQLKPHQGSARPAVHCRSQGTATDTVNRSGHGGHEGVALLAGPPHR